MSRETDEFMPDVESVVHWFMTDKNGEPHKEPHYDEDDLRDLVQRMVGMPHPWNGTSISPARAWNIIIDYGLLHLGGNLGWIRRDGKMYTCGFAKHDLLLSFLGQSTEEAEKLGWIRVNRRLNDLTYRSCFRASPQQRRKLKALGVVVDNELERTLPHWTGMSPETVTLSNAGSDAFDFGRRR